MYLKLTTISVYMEGNEISQTQMKIMKKYEYNKSLLDVLPQVRGFVQRITVRTPNVLDALVTRKQVSYK